MATLIDGNSKPKGEALRHAFMATKQAQPGMRTRDLAQRLTVTEAEVVAAGCIGTVVPLAGRWPEIVKRLPDLGTVMSLTRNEACVHEKVGRYTKVSVFGSMGLVLDPDIDLRIFFNHWHFGYAVTEELDQGQRHSLQFFDLDGTAVQKIFLRAESDGAAYAALCRDFGEPEQALPIVVPGAAPVPDRPDPAIDRTALRSQWEALKDVHDFHAMLNDLGCGRTQALRLVGDDFARKVANDCCQIAIEGAAESGLEIMVFVGSPGVIQIHTGPVSLVKRMGPWFNVLDSDFNLHLREDLIAETWRVVKPTRDGIVTSLEAFDAEGRQIAWVFGKRKPNQPELPEWQDLVVKVVS